MTSFLLLSAAGVNHFKLCQCATPTETYTCFYYMSNSCSNIPVVLQYTSCLRITPVFNPDLLFTYISCYCLSYAQASKSPPKGSFPPRDKQITVTFSGTVPLTSPYFYTVFTKRTCICIVVVFVIILYLSCFNNKSLRDFGRTCYFQFGCFIHKLKMSSGKLMTQYLGFK